MKLVAFRPPISTGDTMINSLTPKPGRRLALAGVLTAAVLAGGAGFAYANSASATQPVESGYATVVDEGNPTADGSRSDCPERGAGGGSDQGSSRTPESTPEQTPEQAPTPEGDL
jgi:hypothetical protein